MLASLTVIPAFPNVNHKFGQHWEKMAEWWCEPEKSIIRGEEG